MTASQKLAALCLPVAAFLLAAGTAGPEWNPPREQGSWRRSLHPPAATPAPAPEAEPGKAPGGEPEREGKEPAKPAPRATPSKPAPKEGAGGTPEPRSGPGPLLPAKGTPPEAPKSIPYAFAGLEVCRHAAPLTTPAAERLDLQVGTSGAVKIGNDYGDLDAARTAMADREGKKGDLLFLVPHSRAPWDAVRDLAAAGAAAGWTRIALAAAVPADPGQARVVAVDLPPPGEPPLGAIPPTTVKVLAGSGGKVSFEVAGDTYEGKEALAEILKDLHEEYEGFSAGYSSTVEKTAWTVDASGATAGGVLQALDALAAAGVQKVRLAGIHRP